ncbi:MAG: hypothetical protein AVDCRST_MAG06-1596, partial [uncultured Nocardioides sp.]
RVGANGAASSWETHLHARNHHTCARAAAAPRGRPDRRGRDPGRHRGPCRRAPPRDHRRGGGSGGGTGIQHSSTRRPGSYPRAGPAASRSRGQRPDSRRL